MIKDSFDFVGLWGCMAFVLIVGGIVYDWLSGWYIDNEEDNRSRARRGRGG